MVGVLIFGKGRGEEYLIKNCEPKGYYRSGLRIGRSVNEKHLDKKRFH